jgi:hypothetical protein
LILITALLGLELKRKAFHSTCARDVKTGNFYLGTWLGPFLFHIQLQVLSLISTGYTWIHQWRLLRGGWLIITTGMK